MRTDQTSVGISPDLNNITFFPGTADSTRIPAARPLTVDRTFRANNFDLSAEWYFGRGALLATTLFYKDIVSSIVPLQTSMPLTITQINLDGSQSRITQDWVLSTLVNRGGSAARR